MRKYCKRCDYNTKAVMHEFEGVVCMQCGKNYIDESQEEEISKNVKEIKIMKVWTNGKGICAYKG